MLDSLDELDAAALLDAQVDRLRRAAAEGAVRIEMERVALEGMDVSLLSTAGQDELANLKDQAAQVVSLTRDLGLVTQEALSAAAPVTPPA